MNKNIFLIVLIWLIGGRLSGQDCFPDTLLLTNQEAIDNFTLDYPNCTNVLGTLIIKEESPGAITNLNGLSQLTGVDRRLWIRDNMMLTSLVGLHNITEVSGLFIENNTVLPNLLGLESLQQIVGLSSFASMEIKDNPALENLNGLDELHTIENRIWLNNNTSLNDLSGMPQLSNIKHIYLWDCNALENMDGLLNTEIKELSSFGIRNCQGLTSFSGFDELEAISSIEIRNCDKIQNLEGLGGIKKIRSLDVSANDSLQTLSGLTSLDTLEGNIDLQANLSLTDLSALAVSSDSLSSLRIHSCHSLESLEGLSSYRFIGSFYVFGNESLIDFTGLENLEKVYYTIDIYDNASLLNFNGLQNLKELERGHFNIASNDALINFEGLSSFAKVGQVFTVRYNDNLQDFTGLESLDTIGWAFLLYENIALESLAGLENLDYLGGENEFNGGFYEGYFQITNCTSLESISAIENASMAGTTQLYINGNDSLAICSQDNICSYLINGGVAYISNNKTDCNTIVEVIQGCFDETDHTSLVGEITTDLNDNCLDDGEEAIPNLMIAVTNDSIYWPVPTNEQGSYWLPVLAGDWTLDFVSPSPFWTACISDTIVQAFALNDTIITDFSIQPAGDCSFIEWDLDMSDLRVCDSSTFVINYCNYGALPSEDLLFTVSLDTFLVFQNASIPYTIDGAGHLIFPVDTLDLFECGSFSFSAFVDCDSLSIWDVQCVDVELSSEELCSPDSLWDGSIVKVSGYCQNDSIYFDLENIGTGDMLQTEQFRVEIVIDDIILFLEVDDFQLEVQQIKSLVYPVGDGQAFYLEADQSPGYPGEEQASVVVTNCAALENNELLLLLPNGDDGDPFSETFCGPIVNSYDPNDKQAIPRGIGPFKEIDKDWRIDYTIRFQNTGNAPANKVVIRDLISQNLDLSTLTVESASHAFTWDIEFGRELVFTFEDIALPDSSTNFAESQGFVSFSINPKETLLPGDEIENTGYIYFDFNDPIITNTVNHRIAKPVVVTSSHEPFCTGGIYNGVIVNLDTIIQLKTEYIEYDSIHFLHLDVVNEFMDTAEVELPIGQLFEGILINGDTSFTVSYISEFGCDSIVHYQASGVVNVNELNHAFQTIEIFPNPVENILSVLKHQNGSAQHWELVNTLGQKVWESVLTSSENLKGIDVADLPSGVYWLQVRSDRGDGVWKIVVR